MQIFAIDRSSRIGKPPEVLDGDLANLDLPDTVFLEVSGSKNVPEIGVGDVVHLGGRRVRIIGRCRARSGIEWRASFYTSLENARRIAPAFEHHLSMLLVKTKPAADVDTVARAIGRLPNVIALSGDEFRRRTMEALMLRTGIGLNFAITALLGLVVGVVLSTVAFFQFASENLPYFALLRAVGARNRTLIGIVLVQSLTAGLIGYGIGMGSAALVTLPGLAPDAVLATRLPWPLVFFGMVPMLACVSAGSLINLRRVLSVDPVILFE